MKSEKEFYWVEVNGEKTWAEVDEDGETLWLCGSDEVYRKQDVFIHSGPHTAHDIDIANFGYWV